MTASDAKSLPSIGFLTVQDYNELGLIGGYLVLNSLGRPLEFHCTAPVRPNRAQEILYGPTLEPYLYGEQIGQTLVSKGKHEPLFICTDVAPAIALREHIRQPVVLLTPRTVDPIDEPGAPRLRVDAQHPAPPRPTTRFKRFELAGYPAAVSLRRPEDCQTIVQQWQSHVDELDLMEPFARLREAINETQAGASRS